MVGPGADRLEWLWMVDIIDSILGTCFGSRGGQNRQSQEEGAGQVARGGVRVRRYNGEDGQHSEEVALRGDHWHGPRGPRGCDHGSLALKGLCPL